MDARQRSVDDLRVVTAHAAAVYVHIGRGVEHLLKHALSEQAPAHGHEALRVFLEHYEQHLLDRTVLYPGVREALNRFSAKRRAVVSNKIHRFALAIVRGLGVEGCFDAIFGGDSAAEKKPHPALLRAALKKFHLPAARALMIGDSDTDIEAGKRAGVATCGVTYGLGNKDGLRAAQPDILIDDLGELCDHFC